MFVCPHFCNSPLTSPSFVCKMGHRIRTHSCFENITKVYKSLFISVLFYSFSMFGVIFLMKCYCSARSSMKINSLCLYIYVL